MPDEFCKYLTNQARIEYGQLRPCCWFTDVVDLTDADAVQTYQKELHSITDFKSAGHRCQECKRREQKGLFSPRLDSFKKLSFSDSDVPGVIKRLEIQIDRDCNAACLVCGPWNSTTWEKYESKLKNIPVKLVGDSKSATYDFIKQITNNINFDEITDILMLGGEPLRTDSHLTLLNEIKNPSDTIVRYTTNGSYRPNKETIETWSKFKEIRLAFSIDGIGEHFNYLRWPLQWAQIEDNIKFLLDLENTNIVIVPFSYTTTALSLYYQDTYEEWARLFFKNSKVDPSRLFQNPWQPRSSPMVLSAIPPNLAKVIQDKYGSDHSITKLIEPYNPAHKTELINYITYHDKNRGTDWRKVFPEMVEYFRYT